FGAQRAVELDAQLNIVQSVVLDPENTFNDVAFTAFAVSGEHLALAGSVTTADRSAGIIRTVLTDGSMSVHDEDVSIQIQSIDSTWYPWSPGYVFPRANVTVRITNEGSTVVDDVVLDHSVFTWDCWGGTTIIPLSNLGLAPGATTTAEMYNLELPYVPLSYIPYDPEICIAALCPNKVYDRDGSDNLACEVTHIALGIPDGSTRPFTLVQDPTNGTTALMFSAPTPSACHIEVLDASGRSLSRSTIQEGTERYVINTSHLAAGLQILMLQDEARGRWTTRWVFD
ncbi:MAG TPA: hypothetical protein PK760_03195, partial [Flavobacteriales bacterium]|nr:hypothetical protein [Flavobacteriales bacterium]